MSITEPMSVKSRTTILEMEKRSLRRKKKGRKKRKRWENLRERGVGGINSTTGVGLTSWNGKPGNSVGIISGGRIPGVFYGNPNPPNVPGGFATKSLEEKSEQYSPRDNDTDVFIDIESARRRARQLGCIGVSRRISKSGKIVWMPCTNMTDYNNLTGMTALGRLNQEKNTQRAVRTVLSQELKKRKKSLVEEIMGKAIGPKISGVSRFAARTITQRFDPNAEDGDGDGLLQDGTAFERPNVPKPKLPINTEQKPISESSINSVREWFNRTPSSRRQELLGESIENFSIRGRSTRGFASASKPIKGEDFGIDGLENEQASSTNPFRNLGGKRMGEIIRGLVKPKNKGKKQRTTYLIGGTTGGGKTTVLDEHLVPKGLVPSRDEAAHVDPDFIKMGLPGYNDGSGAPMVHDESLRAAQHTMDDARKEGADVVATGAGSTRQRAIIAQARQNGDRVVAHWVHISQPEASRRLKERERKSGRKIPDQTDHFARSIPRMVSSAVENGEVDEFYIWDNEVEPGKPPRLLASFKDGKLEVFDQKKLDEFMNGNPLKPKPGDKSVLSDEAREALKESDDFMAGGFASSGKKKKKGGRYTPPQKNTNAGRSGGIPIFGDAPGTGRVTSLRNDPFIKPKVDELVKDIIAKVKDRLYLDKDGNPKNPLNYLGKKVASMISSASYRDTDSAGRPIRLSDLSIASKFNIPQDIDKILDIYAPLKNPNESFEDYAKRILSSVPSSQFTSVARLANGPQFLGDAIERAGYSDELQGYVRDVIKQELTNNPAFAELVKEFGLPFILGAPNDFQGNSLSDESTSAFHNPGTGIIVMAEDVLRQGFSESIGSTIEKRKTETAGEILRHEWFHYLDAVTLASDPTALAKRKTEYAQGLAQLLQNPGAVVKKVLGNDKNLMKQVEEATVSMFRRTLELQGLTPEQAKIKAAEWLQMILQNPVARQDYIDNLLPRIMNARIFNNLIDALLTDRGGIYDDIAKKYTEYARYGMHELLAEIGRIITSTVDERNSVTSNIPSIDSSTVDFLAQFVPSVPRSKWISIIKIAYPGIKIK